jgi:hypothetical protein
LRRAAPFGHTVERQNPQPTGGAGQRAQAQGGGPGASWAEGTSDSALGQLCCSILRLMPRPRVFVGQSAKLSGGLEGPPGLKPGLRSGRWRRDDPLSGIVVVGGQRTVAGRGEP